MRVDYLLLRLYTLNMAIRIGMALHPGRFPALAVLEYRELQKELAYAVAAEENGGRFYA